MRLKEFQEYLHSCRIDFAVFFDKDANLVYFSDARPDSACLVIPSSGKPLLFVPGFEAERISEGSAVDVVKVNNDLFETVRSHFSGRRIGIVSGAVSYSRASALKSKFSAELISVEDKCKELRMTKTRAEAGRIIKACAITDSLFDELCDNFSSFKTELDAASFLKFRMSQLGFEPSFPPIIASGINGATPHHVPDNSKLSGFTVIDFGIIYKNYCSDITRTVFVGVPSEKDKKAYQDLLKVQKQCIELVVPGTTLEEIDKFAHGKVKHMVHRVGHSLGVEVHDAQTRPFRLEFGSVLTIEPGTYTKFGIRIEDDVILVKAPVVLTRSSKELRVIRR